MFRLLPLQLKPAQLRRIYHVLAWAKAMAQPALPAPTNPAPAPWQAHNITDPDCGRVETAPWLAILGATGWVEVIGGPVVPFYKYLGLDFMKKLRVLPKQLRTFDALKFGVFLGSSVMQEAWVDQADPRSRAAIFCDPPLWEKLTELYGDSEDWEDKDMGIERAIEQFSHQVRRYLADVILEMMSGRYVLWQNICLSIGMNCPVCTYLLGDMGFSPYSMEGWALHSWRARDCTSSYHSFLQTYAAVQLFSTLWTLGAIYLKDHHRFMAASVLTPILIVLAVGLFYYPFQLGLELLVDGCLLPPLTADASVLLLLVRLGSQGVDFLQLALGTLTEDLKQSPCHCWEPCETAVS
ncbi:unnamed protein product [Symbiodinium sp. CCMP2592]|nr:unnamed protein product [Symbiodinium sp. CCMP2592]